MSNADIKFYMLRKTPSAEFIYAVTKQTKKCVFGVIIYSSIKECINQKFRIKKDNISACINEYDFTCSLEV